MTNSNHTQSPTPTTIKKPVRQMKVRESHHNYQVYQHQDKRTPVGEIQLKGNWLLEAGFEIGQPVEVKVMPGCLVVMIPPEPAVQVEGFNELAPGEQQMVRCVVNDFVTKNWGRSPTG